MYKLLMVDDEDIIRTGFRERIDWTSAGFEFLTPCSDGRQAMEALERLHPDVVITDICMPLADGLELSAYISEHHPEITVVVLSGYDDFEYARASIRNKVWDYILKPVTAREIGELLVRLKAKLDHGLHDTATTDIGYLRREGELRRFLGSDTAAADIGRFLTGADPADLYFSLVNAEIYRVAGADGKLEPWAPELASYLDAWTAAAFEVSADNGASSCAILVDCVSEQVSCVPARACVAHVLALVYDPLWGRATNLSEFRARRFIEVLRARSYACVIGIGGAYAGASGARQSLDEARQACHRRLVNGEGMYLFEPSRVVPVTEHNLAPDYPQRMTMALRMRDEGAFELLLAEWLDLIAAPPVSIFRVRQTVLSLLFAVADVRAGTTDSVEEEGKELARALDLLCGIDELANLVRRLARQAIQSVESGGVGLAELKVIEFKAYVAKHYRAANLSITEVGKALMLSPSYLSKILKRQLDCSFVDYITGYRVNRAKELLAGSDLKTYEVAEASGYGDSRYFSTVFKRITGLAPTEYRAQWHRHR